MRPNCTGEQSEEARPADRTTFFMAGTSGNACFASPARTIRPFAALGNRCAPQDSVDGAMSTRP